MWASAAIPTSAAGDHGLGLRFYDVPVRATSRRTRQNVPGFGGTQRNKSSKLFLERINVVRLHRPRDMSFRHDRCSNEPVRCVRRPRRCSFPKRLPSDAWTRKSKRRWHWPLPSFASDTGLLLSLYRGMVLTRAFDLKAVSLQRTGRLGTYASRHDHDAVENAVGNFVCDALGPADR
jgi:hypothetical protein